MPSRALAGRCHSGSWKCSRHFFFQAEDGIRDSSTSRGLGDVYKRQVVFGEPEGPVQVFALDVEGRYFASVGETDSSPARDVVADLADRSDRILERQIAEHDRRLLEHPQHEGARADLEKVAVLAHVRIADDHV